MKQVFLTGRGQIGLLQVPLPGRMRDSVLVRNAFSLISSGTEGSAVTRNTGLLGLYEKATASRDRLEQVWKLVQTQGVGPTMELIRNRLDDSTPLGYSCAGQVIELDNDRLPFRVGQRVACMGVGFASHAEYVCVPKNLVVPLPDTVAYEQAAFGALACIALQGIRRLELAPGERVGVIGLGLIGQLAVRLLAAMGYVAYGFDLNAERARHAARVPGVRAWGLGEVDAMHLVQDETDGQGLDGVVICASAKSDEPANLAFDLCRQRGRVSIVGDVGLGLQRGKMYRKELELRLSCSYGPGRYDPAYEVAGHDYPFGLVRWTERRNLEFFVELLGRGQLNLSDLVNARFPVAQATEAYAKVKEARPDIYGVVLDYALPETPPAIDRSMRRLVHVSAVRHTAGTIRVGLIGVGGYAKAVHIPNLRKLADTFRIHGVASRSGATSSVVANRYGAVVSTSDYQLLLDDPDIDAVVISTRHASHARITLDALSAGKHVLVEKPMAITVEDALAIERRVGETGLVLRVGFNRRFSPYMTALRRAVGTEGRRMLTCRINIGAIGGSWGNTMEEGGRLMGEGVHFFDLCNWFMGQAPESLQAMTARTAEITNPNAAVTIRYPSGSVAQVLYTALGHPGLGKEYYEVFGNGRAAMTADYRTFTAHGTSVSVPRRDRGDKGQLAELEEFAAAIRGDHHPIQGADAYAGLLATWMARAVYESAETGGTVPVAVFKAADKAADTVGEPAAVG